MMPMLFVRRKMTVTAGEFSYLRFRLQGILLVLLHECRHYLLLIVRYATENFFSNIWIH